MPLDWFTTVAELMVYNKDSLLERHPIKLLYIHNYLSKVNLDDNPFVVETKQLIVDHLAKELKNLKIKDFYMLTFGYHLMANKITLDNEKLWKNIIHRMRLVLDNKNVPSHIITKLLLITLKMKIDCPQLLEKDFVNRVLNKTY